MDFAKAIELLKDGNYTNVRVFDIGNKKILDLEGASSELLIDQLEKYKDTMASFGKVTFHVATAAQKAQNWKDFFSWPVTFSGAAGNNLPSPYPTHMPGYISATEANLMAQLEGMKKENEFNKRFDELNKKLDDKDNFVKYAPLLPLLGLFIDIKPEKQAAMASLASLAGAMNNNNNTVQTGINGLVPTNKAEVKGTAEEQAQIKSINDNLEKLSEKIPVASIEEFIRTLVEKPEFLTMLMTMSKQFKT